MHSPNRGEAGDSGEELQIPINVLNDIVRHHKKVFTFDELGEKEGSFLLTLFID